MWTQYKPLKWFTRTKVRCSMGWHKDSSKKKHKTHRKTKFATRTQHFPFKSGSFNGLERFKDLEAVHSHLGPNSRVEIVSVAEEALFSTDKYGFPSHAGQVWFNCSFSSAAFWVFVEEFSLKLDFFFSQVLNQGTKTDSLWFCFLKVAINCYLSLSGNQLMVYSSHPMSWPWLSISAKKKMGSSVLPTQRKPKPQPEQQRAIVLLELCVLVKGPIQNLAVGLFRLVICHLSLKNIVVVGQISYSEQPFIIFSSIFEHRLYIEGEMLLQLGQMGPSGSTIQIIRRDNTAGNWVWEYDQLPEHLCWRHLWTLDPFKNQTGRMWKKVQILMPNHENLTK